MNPYDVKESIQGILKKNNLELWIVSVNDPKYAKEPLDSSEHKIVLSRYEAVQLVHLFIRATFGRKKPQEINNATVEGLSDAQVMEIIMESLKEQNMVTIDGVRFDIVKTAIY